MPKSLDVCAVRLPDRVGQDVSDEAPERPWVQFARPYQPYEQASYLRALNDNRSRALTQGGRQLRLLTHPHRNGQRCLGRQGMGVFVRYCGALFPLVLERRSGMKRPRRAYVRRMAPRREPTPTRKVIADR